MRMPRPRHNHSMPHWVRRIWEHYVRKIKITALQPEPELPPGAKVIDAFEFVKPPVAKVIFPEPYAKNPVYLANQGNPDWNERVLHYTRDTKIIEGHRQALVLFNTLQYEGLSKPVESLLDKVELQGADQLLQRKIMSEYVYHSMQTPLYRPKEDPADPKMRIFLKPWGIPPKRKVLALERHLLSLCSMAVGSPSCQRHKMLAPYAKVFFEREGERVLSEVVSDSVFLSSEPLPIADEHSSDTVGQPLVDIYPLSSLLDLAKLNIYKEGHIFCVGPRSPKGFCHLLLLGDWYDEKWLDKQFLARGIASCFTFAASQAYSIFGPSVTKLPEPVVLNCMLFQEQRLAFLTYQLNTLDLNSTDGVRNQVWIDGPHQLFESCDQKNGIVGFNSSVFPKALAMFLNGIKL